MVTNSFDLFTKLLGASNTISLTVVAGQMRKSSITDDIFEKLLLLKCNMNFLAIDALA